LRGDMDPVKMFDQLEKKIEKTLERIKSAESETEKLRKKSDDLQKEVARLTEELSGARKESTKSQEWKAQADRLEEERGKVRERVARLLTALETIDANES